jgi:hypothetical protein
LHITLILFGLAFLCQFSGYNRIMMNMRRNTLRVFTLFAMLSLPLQSLASVLLPCLHDSDSTVTQSASHPCHFTSEPADQSPGVADDCQKCQLCLMLSGSALLTSEQPAFLAGNRDYFLLPVDHFYNFSPGQLQRPPSRITST